MDMAQVRQRARELVEQHAPAAIDVARDINEHPETGFREERTASLVRQWFDRFGLPHRDGLALTGVRADLASSGEGPRVAVMGELDSLIVPGHPFADPNTSFAHACGHHAQIGTMLTVAAVLSDPDVRDALKGHVAFMAVPAEEFIEIEYRDSLRKQGKLEFMGGKAELVRLGEFDDVDISILTHASSNATEGLLAVDSINNGALAKEARFIGVQAHAGSAPHRGINALQAATIAMAAINANRETFQDPDSIRVHPIITRGGDVVNAVPAEVRMEMFVRGRNLEAIADADRKVDRALRAGALAVGGKVEITSFSAYLPLKNDSALSAIYRSKRRPGGRRGQRNEGGAARFVHRHGRSEPSHADHPTLRKRRDGHGARRRFRDRGLFQGCRQPGAGHRPHRASTCSRRVGLPAASSPRPRRCSRKTNTWRSSAR